MENLEKTYKKYPLNSIYFAYNQTGSFFEPFYYNQFKPFITRIDTNRTYILDTKYPKYYDNVKKLFGLDFNSIIYYQPAYSIVARRTTDTNINGKVFKSVRDEIRKFEGQLDRNTVLKAGKFNDLWVDYNDLYPLICQLKSEMRKYNKTILNKTISITDEPCDDVDIELECDYSYKDLSNYTTAIKKYLEEEDEFPPLEF